MLKRYAIIILFLLIVACNKKQTKTLSLWTEPISGMEFVLIPKGSFNMGNPDMKSDSLNNETQHLVTITHDFWLARKEVTLEQWYKVMGTKEFHPEKPNPFRNDNSQYPVVCVSYIDVQNFLRELEKLSSGNRFRLPTEAEWEYACRAGTTNNFSCGNLISYTHANFKAKYPALCSVIGNNIGHPSPVGSYPPNPWGLYDMHGNAFEWVSDWYAPYSAIDAINPQGPLNGTQKVIRGGSWYFGADNARSFARRTHEPNLWGFSIGFRIVCEKDINYLISIKKI